MSREKRNGLNKDFENQFNVYNPNKNHWKAGSNKQTSSKKSIVDMFLSRNMSPSRLFTLLTFQSLLF
jgi:hypothetical protein